METNDLSRAMLEGERAEGLPRLDVARVRTLGLRRRRRRHLTIAGAIAAVAIVVAAVLVTVPSIVNRADGPAPVKPGRINTDAPARGTCWMVDPHRLTTDYWFDDSPRVPCSGPHTMETVLSYDLDKPTPEAAKEMASLCLTQARVYVGSDLAHWVPWNALFFLPSKAQIARGASWVRPGCAAT
jgi:hypothetical protein